MLKNWQSANTDAIKPAHVCKSFAKMKQELSCTSTFTRSLIQQLISLSLGNTIILFYSEQNY